MMSTARRFRLADVVTEIHQSKPTIDIETADGQIFSVPPAELWPDVAIELASTDPVGAARALLGKKYEAFTAAGGSASLLFTVITKAADVAVGESAAS